MARHLPLRARLALLTAAAVALAVAGCAVASWFLARSELFQRLDQSLTTAPMGAGRGGGAGPDNPYGLRPGNTGTPGGWPDPIQRALDTCSSTPQTGQWGGAAPFLYTIQVVRSSGQVCTLTDSSLFLKTTTSDVEVAKGQIDRVFRNGETTSGEKMRIYTRSDPFKPGVAISVAAPLEGTEKSLDNLALLLAVVAAVGVVGAATAGLLVARAALRPVDQLTRAVEHVARTQDLDVRIPASGADEIARLSRSFNTMNAALAGARDRQQQLIADAGHELRTPLTSLRTNIDLLMRAEETGRALPPQTRNRLLTALRAQMRELTHLVGDLLELARPTEEQPPWETVALHEVVARAVERARLRGPGLHVESTTEPWYVHGDPGTLERAVVNLLDNAVKFSPPAGTVEIALKQGQLTVRDEGPGIAAEDLPHVFDRFWRSPSARSLPGSGLGLSIVARVVQECGGIVRLEPADGGGTLARVHLPGKPYLPTR